MRLAHAVCDDRVEVVLVEDEDTARVVGTDPADPDPMLTLLRDVDGIAGAVARRDFGERIRTAELELLPPVLCPGKVVAVGLNYRDHTSETGIEAPAEPLTFAKYPSSLTGQYSDIVIPSAIAGQVDYEAELAVVIGRECPPDGKASLADIAAYSVANDVSARDVQFRDKQWTRGKSFDTFTPLGPCLVTADEVDDPHGLRITTRVNGRVMQDDSTASMVFDIEELLRHINTGTRLLPGDVILTGTPAGAGAFLDPPSFLADGDSVEITIESVGSLRNNVVVH